MKLTRLTFCAKLLLTQRERRLRSYGPLVSTMNWGNAPIWELHENPWDPIPGDLPIRIHPDYDLGVPYTWFEYEMDSRIHYLMTDDQMYIPEDERPFPSPKNPHCSKEMWRPQEDLLEED